MRQSFRDRREHLHRGPRTPRLTTMFLMLAILGLVFVQLRNPGNWRMFGGGDNDGQVAPQPASARTTAAGPESAAQPPKGGTPTALPPTGGTASAAPSGPTDLDPDEMEEIKPSLSVVYDGSLQTKPVEQPAYFRILDWVDHQSIEALRKRAKRDFFYDNLVHSPESMRLQIVEVKLTVLQIVEVMGSPDKDGRPQPLLTNEGSKIYEVRGISQESGSNLYFGMVTDIPAGTPVGPLLNDFSARLVGYFFKVQGYIAKQQQLDFEASRTRKIVPLKAPLIIGRLIPIAVPADTAANNTPVWVLASVGGVAIIVVLGWVRWSTRRKRPSPMPRITTTSLRDPDSPDVDNWLDQAQSGRFDFDPVPRTDSYSEGLAREHGFGDRFPSDILGDRNIFGDNSESKFDESNFGGRAKNGHSSNEGNQYKNGSAGHEPEVRENDNPNN
jgi:hypothetical protein